MNARPRWLDDALVAGGLAVVACALAFNGWIWRLDRMVYDQVLGWWPMQAPSDVVIVAIDDASIAAIGQWPWSRAVHATLLQRLAPTRPKAVALDLILSEPAADPRQDTLLAQAIASGPPVVLPVGWRIDESLGLLPILPVEPVKSVVQLGMVDPSADSDGVLRHAFLEAGPTGKPLPHLARALLMAGGEIPATKPPDGLQSEGATSDFWERSGRFAIRFAGPPGTIRTVSYVDVLTGAVPASTFSGKYVLVGSTAQALGDRRRTPADDGGPDMTGIEIHANVLGTVRQDAHITELPTSLTSTLFAVALTLLVLVMTRAGPRRALGLALSAVVGAFVLSAMLLRANVWIGPTAFAFPALLAYPLWSWRRLDRTIAVLDLEIAALGRVTEHRRSGDAVETRLTILRDAGEAVRRARTFLADANAALPAAMLVADSDQRVQLANPRAAGLFDVADAEELVGLHLGRLLAELSTRETHAWVVELEALPNGDEITAEARSPSGAELMVHVAAVEQEGSRRFVVSLSDIAKVRQAEREREEALAFVSHDLRGPAASIVLLADLNLKGGLSTPREELLGSVRELAGRTLTLADAFVRASQADLQDLKLVPIETCHLLSEAVQDLLPQASSRDIRVDVTAPDSLVVVDRFLVARALGNLVSNAIRHAPPGSVVRVQAKLHHNQLLVRVADHGPGFSAQQVSQLNEAGRGASVSDARGVGLGLVFVQRVARRHGGSLRVLPSTSGANLELVIDSGNP